VNTRRPSAAATTIVVPIGTAVRPPPMPTSGAANPPTRNCEVPRSADALPARDGWPARARVVAAGSTNPTPQTVTNRPGTSAQGPAGVSAPTRTATEPISVVTSPIATVRCGATRSAPTSRPATWVAVTIPTELTANTPLNAWGLSP
jgi:hypothetical protein